MFNRTFCQKTGLIMPIFFRRLRIWCQIWQKFFNLTRWRLFVDFAPSELGNRKLSNFTKIREFHPHKIQEKKTTKNFLSFHFQAFQKVGEYHPDKKSRIKIARRFFNLDASYPWKQLFKYIDHFIIVISVFKLWQSSFSQKFLRRQFLDIA